MPHTSTSDATASGEATATASSVVPAKDGAFAAYATTAWPRLVRTAHLLTGDLQEAEDLVRTTLARVCARWRRIPRDDVDFYVRRSLVKINLGRTRKRRAVRLLMPFLPRRVRQPEPGPAKAGERRAALDRALATLSARRRTVMVLSHWEGLGEAEIAQLLGCSVGTVKAHARRGLAALRAHPSLASALAASAASSAASSPTSPTHRHPVSGARS